MYKPIATLCEQHYLVYNFAHFSGFESEGANVLNSNKSNFIYEMSIDIFSTTVKTKLQLALQVTFNVPPLHQSEWCFVLVLTLLNVSVAPFFQQTAAGLITSITVVH